MDVGGRDPLGLSRVAQTLTDYLLPGIITTTDRARYYSLYCWIIWHINEEGESRTYDDFARSFQRREAAVALACVLEDDRASPVGVESLGRYLSEARGTDEVTTAFQVLPSNRLGGFGQYYSGSLKALGLVETLEDGTYRVREGRGLELAKAVSDVVRQTPYIKATLFKERKVDLDQLTKSSSRLSLEALGQAFGVGERDLLIDLFFGFSGNVGHASLLRRESLARLLTAVVAYEKAGVPVQWKTFDLQVLYAPAYFGVLVEPDGSPSPFVCPEGLVRCSSFWRQFGCHQILTQALEGILTALLDLLGGLTRGYTPAEAAEALTDTRFFRFLKETTGRACSKPRDLMKALGLEEQPAEGTCTDMRRRHGWGSALDDWAFEMEAIGCGQLTARSCLVLAILYTKWRGITKDATYLAVAEKGRDDLCAPSFLPLLDEWFQGDVTWQTILEKLITLLHKQHDRVMYGKGRLESRWLRLEENRITREQEYEPEMRSSRHKQAAQILVDLGLLQFKGDDSGEVGTTSAGRSVLKRALKAAT